MKVITICFAMLICSCSMAAELNDKEQWSILQAADWQLKDRSHRAGALVLSFDDRPESRVLALPLANQARGYGVVMMKHDVDGGDIKHMPRRGFVVRREDVELLPKEVKQNNTLYRFLIQHSL